LTTEDLRQFISNLPHPITLQTLEVNYETFANACQFLFASKSLSSRTQHYVSISLGKNNGIMFNGIELILEKKNE